jgi:hypothetical protein
MVCDTVPPVVGTELVVGLVVVDGGAAVRVDLGAACPEASPDDDPPHAVTTSAATATTATLSTLRRA